MKVKIKTVENGKLPTYGRSGDACLDCYARIENRQISIPSHSRTLVSLGFCLEIPDGYEAVIRPRSGLSSRSIDICIGTVDSNYRGEVKACVVNNSDADYEISNGDRICQLAIRRAPHIDWMAVNELSETVRGNSGFGSSGI